MEQQSFFIKNRDGYRMSIRITIPSEAHKLAFLEHGFSGDKNEPHMLIAEDELIKNGYIVVNMDAINSLNESDSSPEGASFTGHYHDLEDVIAWAESQPWFTQPFTLIGHSMGAAAVLYYAENYPQRVERLLLLSLPWLSGAFKLKQDKPDFIENWKKTGYWNKVSQSRNRTLTVPYHFIEDLLKYDFAEKASQINAKTRLIIGALENEIRLADNKKLLEMLQCDKELVILPNTPHCPATTPDNAETYRSALQLALK